MSTTNEIPDNFSGVVEFKIINADFYSGTETVSIYIKHYRNGVLHREDGPAVLLEGMPYWREYWVNGRKLSEEEYGHFLEKKALKEKLESSLGEKKPSKRGKI